MRFISLLLLTFALCSWGCAKRLLPVDGEEPTKTEAKAEEKVGELIVQEGDAGTQEKLPEKDITKPSKITVSKDGDKTKLDVNASDDEGWVYFSFETHKEAFPKDPETSKDWDLAFQRFFIMSNGGVHGKGGVKVAVVKKTTFDKVTTIPDEKDFIEDQDDGDDINNWPDYAFLANGDYWFSYGVGDHVLKPKPYVFVIKTTLGLYYKFEIVKYYDTNGLAGFPLFRYEELKKK